MLRPNQLTPGLLAAALLPALLPAQTGEPVKLDELRVEEVPIEENILPSSRPFNSVFGLDQSILDTPRNVTIISRQQLNDINIADVRDFLKLTSSSYTTTNFGAPSNPTIRGQFGDLFINGMRRVVTSNGNGLPINFNSVESVNILKGPATVVHGPSFYVGGFVDFITKRPYFDGFKGAATFTAGMYDQYRWTLDFGGPISEKTAYRVSYSGEQSGSYYYDGKKHFQAIYGAITHRPNDRYELFVNTELFLADYTENFGINRPTQDLIDNGRYVTGVNNNPAPVGGGYTDSAGRPINFGNVNVPAGPAAPTSDPQNSRWVTTGFPVLNRMVYGPTVDIDRRRRLLKPGDDSEGTMFNLQAISTFKSSPSLTVENNSYFVYVTRNTLSSYHYSEIIDPSTSFENRTEFQISLDDHEINTGFSLRWQYVEAFNHFFFEPAAVWDLTRDLNFVDVYRSVNWPDASPVPGWDNRFATPGVFNGDTNQSTAYQAAAFYQHQWKVTDRLTLLGGGRLDVLRVEGEDPLKPFFISKADDELTLGLPNANASVNYRLQPNLSVYATVNYSQNYGGAVGNGGGFGQLEAQPGDTTGAYRYSLGRFRQESELYEAGAKATLLEDTLFVGGAVFRQTRNALQLDGSVREFEFTGFEIEANYQPSRNLYLTASYSYLNAVSDLPQFDVGNVAPALPGVVRFFQVGSGVGDYRIQGLPRSQANFLMRYEFDAGYGFTVGAWLHDEINNNVAGTLVIPWQYQIDVTGFYKTGPWEFRLGLINVTDEKNWSPPNSVYGNESIQAEWPFRAEMTVGYRF